MDLVQTSTLDSEQRYWMERAEHPIALETANDRVEADQCVAMQILELGENIEPLCLAATPSVLNLGRRCHVQGYGFYWHPYTDIPVLTDPKGVAIPVESTKMCHTSATRSTDR